MLSKKIASGKMLRLLFICSHAWCLMVSLTPKVSSLFNVYKCAGDCIVNFSLLMKNLNQSFFSDFTHFILCNRKISMHTSVSHLTALSCLDLILELI